MTTVDIDAIEALANAATPGLWKYVDTEDGLFGVEMDAGHNILWDMEGACEKCFGNMRFIAAARQDVPALCAEVRELRAALERARALAEKWRTYWPASPGSAVTGNPIQWTFAAELAAALAEGGRP